MTTTQNRPSSPASFRRQAEQAFRNANSDAELTGLVIKWLRCNRVKWFDGSAGFSGTMEVSAPGFKPRTMIASFGQDAVTVR
jgi:hypothetical protein